MRLYGEHTFQRLADLALRIQRLEISLNILEAKVICMLLNLMVNTPDLIWTYDTLLSHVVQLITIECT